MRSCLQNNFNTLNPFPWYNPFQHYHPMGHELEQTPGNNIGMPQLSGKDLVLGITQLFREHACIPHLRRIAVQLEYTAYKNQNNDELLAILWKNAREILEIYGVDVSVESILLARDMYLSELASPVDDDNSEDIDVSSVSQIPSKPHIHAHVQPTEILSTDYFKDSETNLELFLTIMEDQAADGIPIVDLYDFASYYLAMISHQIAFAHQDAARRGRSIYGIMD